MKKTRRPQGPKTCYQAATIGAHGQDQDVLEVFADGTKEQTLGFVFEEHLAGLLPISDRSPHDCADPKCPGRTNKRKLEIFPDLLRLLGDALPYLEANAADVERLLAHGDEEGKREHTGILSQIKEMRTLTKKAKSIK